MNGIHTIAVALGFCTFAGSSSAADVPVTRGGVQDVQIMSNGTVVGTARISQGATLEITADRVQGDDHHRVHAYMGNVSLVATADGRQLVTLQGDQLIVKRSSDQ